MKLAQACISLISLAALLIVLNCGERECEEPYPVRSTIGIRDSIGAEFGDTSFVFGSISDALFSPAGEIFILDQTACCIRKYSEDGVFLDVFSREGNGPGELRFPTDIAVSENGEILIRDTAKLALIVLDESGESIRQDFLS